MLAGCVPAATVCQRPPRLSRGAKGCFAKHSAHAHTAGSIFAAWALRSPPWPPEPSAAAAMTSRAEFSLAGLAGPSPRCHSQGPCQQAPSSSSVQRAPPPARAWRPPEPGGQLSSLHQARSRRRRGRRQACTCSAAAIGLPGDAGATLSGAVQPVRQAASSLYHRSVSGCLLGLSGAAVILAGGWVFTLATCALVHQFSQEFYGFVTSKDISEGMLPPPPLVSALTSLSCIGLTLWMHVSAGRSTAALAVSSFVVLSLQLLAVERPHFSQMTSAVFGLFYCGAPPAVVLPMARVPPRPPHAERAVFAAGYLPSFWVKLRLLAAPAISSTVVHGWPVRPGSAAPACAGPAVAGAALLQGAQGLPAAAFTPAL